MKSQSQDVNKGTVVTVRLQSLWRETVLSGTGSAVSLRSIDSLANQKPNVLIQVYSLVLFDSAVSLLMEWGAGDGWWRVECLSALQRASVLLLTAHTSVVVMYVWNPTGSKGQGITSSRSVLAIQWASGQSRMHGSLCPENNRWREEERNMNRVCCRRKTSNSGMSQMSASLQFGSDRHTVMRLLQGTFALSWDWKWTQSHAYLKHAFLPSTALSFCSQKKRKLVT